jgi:methionine aminotransferase
MSMSENSKNIKPKLPHVGTTIFAVMSKLAHEHGALNLSQGFPDFPVSPELIDRVTHYMKSGYNQYAPMTGVQPLREQICRKAEILYGARYHPEKEINVTSGATQALYTAIAAVVHAGDEVILFSPAYDSYAPAVEVHGGVPVFSHLRPPGYTIDWDEVRGLINRKTRMIVVNTPHNPTGSILTDRDMRALEELTRGTDILVISDEVYEHIIFDGTPHSSAMLYPGLRERSFVVFSFGKTFHSTGWKMGYCMAPDELMREFRSVHQFLVYCCNTPIQHAIADFLKVDANYTGISPMYQAKRDLFLERLKASRFKFTPTCGSYFQLLDYSGITDEGDMDFAVRLTEEHKVASIPVSVFYPDAVDNRVLRFCFAKREETLEKAAEILCRI